MARFLAAFLCIAYLTAANAVQQPLPFGDQGASFHDDRFKLLDPLSTSHFTSLGHPAFPDYNVRIKESNFCDGTARAFTGYIDFEARHLFFYFFESRNNPDKDDVIFYTNGGPGCSSAVGVFMEIGPCKVNDVHNVTFNTYSWNENANVLFVDQPVGVGYSYADHGEYVSTTEEAAKDVAAFVAIFFEHFSSLKGRPFHMASMSYGGRYIPTFASAIYDQNARLDAAGVTPINLTSIIIANGCTDWKTMWPAYYTVVCEHTSHPPVLDVSTCVEMKRALPRCERWLKKSCYDAMDAINCRAAMSFCEEHIETPFMAANYNMYDVTKRCTPAELQDSLCYPVTKKVASFLDRPDVRKTLGVDSKVPENYTNCNHAVSAHFGASLDQMFPADYYIEALLERGVRVLLYAGENDWVCNWVGNERMSRNLEWSGQEAFAAEPLREWHVRGRAAGVTRGSGPLVFATVRDAGHLVPYDKGEEVLVLVQQWLAGKTPQ